MEKKGLRKNLEHRQLRCLVDKGMDDGKVVKRESGVCKDWKQRQHGDPMWGMERGLRIALQAMQEKKTLISR